MTNIDSKFSEDRPSALKTKALLAVLGLFLIGAEAWMLFFLIGPVPLAPRHYSNVVQGTLPVQVFVARQDLGLREAGKAIAGGLIYKIQELSGKTSHAIEATLGCFFLLCSWVQTRVQKKRAKNVLIASALFFAIALSIFLSFRLSQGWDELYLNLRHSYMLAHHGVFSCNWHERNEATVDFLPFFITGILGGMGFPMEAAILGICLMGMALLIVTSYYLSFWILKSELTSLLLAAMVGLLPPVLYVGATGFTADLFSGVFLLGLGLSFIAPSKFHCRGLVWIGLLPLFRTEGILLGALVWIIEVISLSTAKEIAWPEKLGKLLYSGIILAGPFLLISLARYEMYGHIIPTPITFKNTHFQLSHLQTGLAELSKAMLQLKLPVLLLLAAVPFYWGWSQKKLSFRIWTMIVITFLFIIPYFMGGGDWFPPCWNRYMLPFTVTFYLMSGIAICCFVQNLFPRWGKCILLILAVFLIPIWMNFDPKNSKQHFSGWFAAAAELAPDPGVEWLRSVFPRQSDSAYKWQRIDYLSACGSFLGKTTPENAVVCSPEMATLMYFADRELLDMCGMANPRIAVSDFDPMGQGDLTQRKRAPYLIKEKLPEIIAMWDLGTPLPEQFFQDVNAQKACSLLKEKQFTQPKVNSAFYRFGPISNLEKLGYRHVAVITKSYMFNYYVHSKIWAYHMNALKKLNVELIGEGSIPYQVSPEVAERYPAEVY